MLQSEPLVVCDTGHNAHGMREVAECKHSLEKSVGRLICVVGFSADKDIDEMLQLLPKQARYIFTQALSERAADAAVLAEKASAVGLQCQAVRGVADAFALAKSEASHGDAVFVGGSNFVVAEVL